MESGVRLPTNSSGQAAHPPLVRWCPSVGECVSEKRKVKNEKWKAESEKQEIIEKRKTKSEGHEESKNN